MAIGLEKENLVFNYDLKAVQQKERDLPKHVTLDFADHQLEVVSTPKPTVRKLLNQMYSLLDSEVFTNNMVWPLSQGYGIDDFTINGKIKQEDRDYRAHLKASYDNNLLLLSGIHFNYSSNKEFNDYEEGQQYHFDLLKKAYEYGPILSQFVSFTPYYYESTLSAGLDKIGKNFGFDESISLRNTLKYGYYNEDTLNLDYTSLETYRNSINDAVETGKIACKAEQYSKVRLKAGYLELRFIDLNPFSRLGIREEVLTLLTKSLEYFETIKLENFDIDNALLNFEKVAVHGRDKQMNLLIGGKDKNLKLHTNHLINEIINNTECSIEETEMLVGLLDKYNDNMTDLDKMLSEIEDNDMSIEEFGKKHMFTKQKFSELYPQYNMELSTKILMKEAENKGLKVNVLDEESNVIELSKDNHSELIVQATKTNADKYANVLMLENKFMTKLILERNGINVPRGQKLTVNTKVNYEDFKNNKMVVKPLDTNFGLGISILESGVKKNQVDKAVKLAFEHSNVVLTEQFAPGKEYRFLVINNELVSVVHRIPAHVIGDGIHSITELVDIKNSNPLRGKNYHRPVEEIKLGEFELDYLKQNEWEVKQIPNRGQKVYLRENSNVSTGGDSYEVMDQIPNSFCKVAVKAAQALDTAICGIDMIIEDIGNIDSEYTIIEANFNPAIQMHTYPYYGYGKNVAEKIIELLF